MKEIKVVCFACGGDGKETCDNPDYGFISMMSAVRNGDIGRLGCPVCGHDENYKVRHWRNGKWEYDDCDICGGSGELKEQEAHKLADEYGYDEEFKYIEEP